jgi:adenylate cyclase
MKGAFQSLLELYAHQGLRYLDLYGPPRTITTIEYADALKLLDDAAGRKRFSKKSVFIGLSERLQPEQKDSYYTVFSREDGVDINGVEIAATAFANLLENRTVRWPYGAALGFVLAWGLAVGMIARMLPTPRAAFLITGLAVLYVVLIYQQFTHSGLWLPLVVPLLLQAPAAFAVGALAHYRQVSREKDNVRRAFGHFLPELVVDELARDVSRIPKHSQLVSGTCLATDVAGYTTIAEKFDPGELRLVMNAYYEQVFRPVTTHGGIISDVVGDAMVAIWAAASDSASLRAQACRAALEITAAAEAFGRTAGNPTLPTRIGLESGRMALGNVGGISHYEYRAVGDIVNTASRIQDLNKTLGTRVLVSASVFERLDGLLGRRLGSFRLRGKSKPVTVYELAGVEPDVADEQRWLCRSFEQALNALEAQRRDEARDMLIRIAERFPDDGATRFYLQLLESEQHRAAESWDGVVTVG